MSGKYTIAAHCFRYDTWELKSPQKTEEGFLRADAYLTRPGVFDYIDRKELRPSDEVFKQDSLSTLSLLPLTLRHPPELITPETAKEYSVGSVGSPRIVKGKVAASILITHQDAIEAVEKGDLTEISCGYNCHIEPKEGNFEGTRYDYVQSNIRYNHVALVDTGRAGSDIRVRMDTGKEWCLLNSDNPGFEERFDSKEEAERRLANIGKRNTQESKMVRIDGIEFDVSDPAKQAVEKALEGRDTSIKELKEGQTKLQSRIDELTAKVDVEKERADELEKRNKELSAPSLVADQVKARLGLERQAAKVLKDEVKLDGMSDDEIKKAVIKEVSPNADLKDKSEDYINARFDAALEIADKGSDLDKNRATVDGASTEPVNAAEKARLAMIERNRNAWKGGEK